MAEGVPSYLPPQARPNKVRTHPCRSHAIPPGGTSYSCARDSNQAPSLPRRTHTSLFANVNIKIMANLARIKSAKTRDIAIAHGRTQGKRVYMYDLLLRTVCLSICRSKSCRKTRQITFYKKSEQLDDTNLSRAVHGLHPQKMPHTLPSAAFLAINQIARTPGSAWLRGAHGKTK